MVVNFKVHGISRATYKLVEISMLIFLKINIMHAWYSKVCLHDVLKPIITHDQGKRRSNNYNLEDKIFPELISFSFFFFVVFKEAWERRKREKDT